MALCRKFPFIRLPAFPAFFIGSDSADTGFITAQDSVFPVFVLIKNDFGHRALPELFSTLLTTASIFFPQNRLFLIVIAEKAGLQYYCTWFPTYAGTTPGFRVKPGMTNRDGFTEIQLK
jgi:hypothetical protein